MVLIRSYVEGGTEKAVLAKLRERFIEVVPEMDINGAPHKGWGKDAIKQTIARLGPDLGKPIRCLFMRDVDHGETIEEIVREYENDLNAQGKKRGVSFSFSRMTGCDNVYISEAARPETRVAIHLSAEKIHAFDHFCHCTTDDYLLGLMRKRRSSEGFYHQLKMRAARRANPPCPWPPTTGVTDVHDLATQIIALLEDRRLPARIEAKMYLRVYELMARENIDHEEGKQRRGIRKSILEGADKSELEQTFKSLIEAIRFLNK